MLWRDPNDLPHISTGMGHELGLKMNTKQSGIYTKHGNDRRGNDGNGKDGLFAHSGVMLPNVLNRQRPDLNYRLVTQLYSCYRNIVTL